MKHLALLPLLFCVACAGGPLARSERMSDGRYVMGTILEITLHDVQPKSAQKTFDELFGHAARLEGLMTLFDSKSEISRLNQSAGLGPREVDPAVEDLLRRSVAYGELTLGTFDVTVGPLVKLWIDAAVDGAPPTPDAIARTRKLVGPGVVRFFEDGRVELATAGVVVDLGGIAKGYALDGMIPLLRERGIDSALLSFGQSSTVAVGAPDNGDGWRLLARGPEEEVLGVLTLRDQALSVSSSFGHWLDVGEKRYGHVIDPRTGRPLVTPREALIVAPDATLAEALSKALLILPPDAGLALVEAQPGCEGMLVGEEGGLRTTPGWQSATRWAPGVPAFD